MPRSTPFRSAFLRAPLLRAVTPFIIGLVIGRAWSVPVPVAWGLTVSATVAWGLIAFRRTSFAQRWRAGAFLWLVWTAFGLLWMVLHAPGRRADDLAHTARSADGGAFRITEVIGANMHHARAWAEADAVHTPVGMHRASGRVCLSLALDSMHDAPEVGDHVVVQAAIDTIARTSSPGGFDLCTWAASNGAWHQANVRNGAWRITEHAGGGAALFDGWRKAISTWLRGSALDAHERGLVKAILIGVRDELDQDQKDAFARSGTMHVLAVSGSHVGLIYAAFMFGLAFLGQGRAARIARGSIAIVMLWTYAGLTGFTPSVLRATVTFTFFSIAEMTPWRTEPLNSLFGAAGILLLWDPDMLVQLSFQLSFLAVLGIALFYRPLMDLWAAPGRVLHYLWSLVCVSLAAQAMTTPLSLLTFQAFPVWFLPANMLIVGLVSIGVFGGTALLLFHAVPVLGVVVTKGMEGLLMVLDRASSFFAQLPGAYPAVRIDVAQCVGLYALITVTAAWLLQGWKWARWAAAGGLFVVLVQWGYAAHRHNGQHLLIVHDERSAVSASVVHGRERVVYADTLTAALRSELGREARAVGVDRTVYVPLQVAGAPIFVDRGRRVLVIGHWVRRRAPRIEGPIDVVVLGADLRGRAREEAAAWAHRTGAEVYDQRERGAYVR